MKFFTALWNKLTRLDAHWEMLAITAVLFVLVAGWFAIHLGGDLAENRCNNLPGFARTTRHERRTFERAFFTAGDTASDKVNSFSFEIFAATLRVGEK